MKFRKLLLKTMPVVVFSTSMLTSLASCSSTNKLPKITNHEIRKALINKLVKPITGNPYYRTSGYGDIEVHHFNGSEIGYINVDDYVSTLMVFEDIFGSETGNYTSSTSDYKTVIKNTVNNSTCTIDYENQKIVFSDYDAFLCFEKAYATNPLAHGAGGGEQYYVKNATTGSVLAESKYVCGGEYTIDLTKYSIKIYYDDNKGYIPYDLFRNILNSNVLTYLFYNGVHFYEINTLNNTNTTSLYKTIREESTILTEEYMEYCYNLLALTLDTRFGLYERPSRTEPGTTIKYFENGAYDALAPYKEGLTSLTPDISNDYMCQFFADHADDGGHAGYSGLDILSTRPHERTRGPESTNTFDVMDMLNTSREAYYAATGEPVDPQDYWLDKPVAERPSVIDNFLYLYGNDESKPILYITFDAFNHIERYDTSAEEILANKVIYDKVNADNYTLDTIRMTMYADKFIRDYNDTTKHPTHIDDKKLTNIVIDLSNNGGGTVYTEHFLASWLCGGVTETIWNPHTKSYAQYKIEADVNGDNKFDQNDYLSTDANVYCITSECSFSCGNMLPCNLVDNRKNNTYFIGCPSGGGACFVDGNMHVGLGNVFRSSSNSHMLKNTSTEGNPVSVESGCQPASWFISVPSTWEKCYGYVDRQTINTKIRG